MKSNLLTECTHCQGKGYIITRSVNPKTICPKCLGKGTIRNISKQ